MTELERIARQYVAENRLTLGEQLALSVFVAKAREVLEPKQAPSAAPVFVVDEQRGWRLT
jgi:hypothetical protein